MTSSSSEGIAAILDHPNGSKAYLVGAAHVSKQAAEDAQTAILERNPRYVFLELDQERYKALLESMKSGDKYGVERVKVPMRKLITMVINGTAPVYLLSSMYVVVGALLGSPNGAEFMAAIEAANQVGAEIVLGDRPLEITIQRLMFKARQYQAERSRQPHAPLSHTPADTGLRRSLAEGSQDRALVPSSSQQDSLDAPRGGGLGEPSRDPMQQQDQEQSWGLDDYVLPGGRKAQSITDLDTWKRLLKSGGCEDADDVLRAFRRIIQAGSKGSAIPHQDILTVRSCGRKLVDNFRQKAVQEGDKTLREVEMHAVAGVKGAAGLEPSLEALNEVLGRERDVILASRLLETAASANGMPLVGVVGAMHVPGIKETWPKADSPEVQRLVQEYMSVPLGSRAGLQVSLPTIATGALLGYITWKQPRAALVVASAAAAVAAPYIGFAAAALNRWQKFTQNLVEACQTVDILEQNNDVDLLKNTDL